jgi:hypothetical protein
LATRHRTIGGSGAFAAAKVDWDSLRRLHHQSASGPKLDMLDRCIEKA